MRMKTRSSNGSQIASKATSKMLMSVTKKPQASAPTRRNAKAIQSMTFSGRANLPPYKVYTPL